MDMNTFLLVCVLAWLVLGALLTWMVEKARLCKTLRAENEKLRQQLKQTEHELFEAEETLHSRLTTRKLVVTAMRDAEIDRLLGEVDRLRGEVANWEKKYNRLQAMRQKCLDSAEKKTINK